MTRAAYMLVLAISLLAGLPSAHAQVSKAMIEAQARKMEAEKAKLEAEKKAREAAPITLHPEKRDGTPNLKAILDDWAAKARKSREDLKVYPQPDKQTAAHGMGLVDDQIIHSLGTRIDKDPELDAWLKLQLFYFRPRLDKATDAQFLAMIEALPPYAGRAQPPSSLMPLFERGERKALDQAMSSKLMEKYREIQGDAESSQAIAYRAKIKDALRRENGLRFCVTLQDLIDRYMAADPACKEAKYVESLMTEAQGLSDKSVTLSDTVRRHLLIAVKRLQQFQQDRRAVARITDITTEGDGKFKIERIGPPISEEQLSTLNTLISQAAKPAEASN